MPYRATGRLIWIAEDVLASLAEDATQFDPLETGGVLLGYWAGASAEAVVTHQIGAGPKASHIQVGFEPDYDYQNAEIERLYHDSGRRLHYLGDWHSHPGGNGYLSSKDRATFLRIARHKEARASHPIMVVLAGAENWSVHAWQLQWKHSWFCRSAKAVGLTTRIFK